MSPDARAARSLMSGFAGRTGLTTGRPPQRYLWTDAFAVCNFLTLGERALALRLIDQVHHVLGRHRPDDARAGWISGLSEEAGEEHPTRGGLRIGKALPERAAGEPADDALEWDRDGQYFHYLTRWMHALRQAGEPRFDRWARELAETAWKSFTRGGRMVWKMSIDLSRPLVSSMGQHDPLDGYLTCLELRADGAGPDLAPAIGAFEGMLAGRGQATADPLGLGSLLADAWRVQQLAARGRMTEQPLLDTLLEAAIDGLRLYQQTSELRQPAPRRLAFRELGLSIGLRAVERMQGRAAPERIAALARSVPLAERIESFWLAHREAPGWAEHREINEVMLATSLAPEGYLDLV